MFPFSSSSFSWESMSGCSVESQGRRREMEDEHFEIPDLRSLLPVEKRNDDLQPAISAFGLFDGHCGVAAAKCCKKLMPEFLAQRIYSSIEKVDALTPEFVKQLVVDFDLRMLEEKDLFFRSGCTLCLVLVVPKGENSFRFICAHAGDSRIGKFSITQSNQIEKDFETKDHKPEHPKEKERIEKAGGDVRRGRVWGYLNLSRSLGDFQFKQSFLPFEKQAVVSVPDVTILETREDAKEEFLFLLCDGFYEIVGWQEDDEESHFDRWFKAEILNTPPEKDLELMQSILNRQLRQSADNCTGILIRMKKKKK